MVSSGLVVRLQERVGEHFPALLEEAKTLKEGRAQWLLKQLDAMKDNEQAQAIAEQYRKERRRDSLVRAQRYRYRGLRTFRHYVETATERSKLGYQKHMETIEREIAKATTRHGELLTLEEIQRILGNDKEGEDKHF